MRRTSSSDIFSSPQVQSSRLSHIVGSALSFIAGFTVTCIRFFSRQAVERTTAYLSNRLLSTRFTTYDCFAYSDRPTLVFRNSMGLSYHLALRPATRPALHFLNTSILASVVFRARFIEMAIES
ncbi:hypothetical protein ACRALDRAFT_211504 [Sodiomyces alcalophilus JCM 7366]|uniref:uncharacterized protein n=1 Tax=Sodiomyces alcalophilus JCM 7366 TaxID=591952 RepID=UPI0039B365F0